MNDNKFPSYAIKWTQKYNVLQDAIDLSMDYLLETSEYKEAKELINRIKEQSK